jgi:hypothetical protein
MKGGRCAKMRQGRDSSETGSRTAGGLGCHLHFPPGRRRHVFYGQFQPRATLPRVWAVVYEWIANGTVPMVSELTAWMVTTVSESEITT